MNIKVKQGARGRWFWRVVDREGKTLANGVGSHETSEAAHAAAERLRQEVLRTAQGTLQDERRAHVLALDACRAEHKRALWFFGFLWVWVGLVAGIMIGVNE